MQQEERLSLIMQYLKMHQRISIEQICEMYGVSRDSARRDIVKLEERGDIIRIRGGALLPTLSRKTKSYEERLLDDGNKREIGKKAASLVKNGDYIIMDTATTVQYAAENLTTQDHVVVTNSIDIAGLLGRNEEIQTHLIGGQFNGWHRNIVGPRAISMLQDYQVDVLFLGACGITHDGLSTSFVDEAYVKQEMIKRADKIIVLADETKFGKRLFHRVCDLDQVDVIVTDAEPDEQMREVLEKYDIELILTGGEK